MNSLSSLLGSASLVALFSFMVAPAMADDTTAPKQETKDSSDEDDATKQLAPIVITGEKFSRTIDDTATSVVPITSQDIAKKPDASDVSDIINDIPNILYTGAVDGAPVIRGQATQGANTGAVAFFGGTVPRATINLDGHYQSYYEFVFGSASIWDVDSVEVFRGPQTSSQGANSIAGAIVVKTKDPTFDHEAAFQAEIGNYNKRRASAMYSGPISNDLAVRIALDHSSRDTFINYNNPAFSNDDIDLDFKSEMGRIKLLWLPSELPDLEAKYTLSHSDSTRPSLEAANEPYDDLDNSAASMPNFRTRTTTHVLDVSYDFANDISLYNQAQYSDLYTKRNTNPSSSGEAFLDQENLSNETRMTFGDQHDEISGLAGYYVSHNTSEEGLYLRGKTHFDDTKNNIGLFGEANYKLADRWTLSGGLRYEHDTIERNGYSNWASSDLDYDETFEQLLPKVSLSYDLTPKVTVGALVKRGYNPGGVSLDFTGTQDYLRFDEETLWDYELFTRARFLDDKLFVNANLFYMDISDAQRYFQETVSGTTNIYVLNAEKAASYGLEVSADYQVLENVRLKAGAGLLQTEIKKFSARPSYEGNDFNKSPAYTLNAGIEYDILPELHWSIDARYTDGYYSDTANTAEEWVKGYGIVNTRLSYDVQENIELYGYVNNLFDERTPTAYHASYGAYVTEPLMFGAGVKVSF